MANIWTQQNRWTVLPDADYGDMEIGMANADQMRLWDGEKFVKVTTLSNKHSKLKNWR